MYKKVWCRGELFFLLLIKAPSTRIRWKRSPKTHLFKDAGFSSTCGRTEVEVFEYDDVIHYIRLALRMLCGDAIGSSTVLAFSCGRAKTIRTPYVWTRIFFGQRREKNSVLKNIWIRMDAACYYRRIEHIKNDESYVIPFLTFTRWARKDLEKTTAIIRQKYNKNNMIFLAINISYSQN